MRHAIVEYRPSCASDGGTDLDHPAIISRPGKPFRRSRGAVLCTIAALLGLLGILHASSAEPLSREEFTQNFVLAYKAAQPGAKIRILGPLQLAVIDDLGIGVVASLEDAFVDYRLDPGDLETIVRRHVATFAAGLPVERRPVDR